MTAISAYIIELIAQLARFIFTAQEGTAASTYDRIKAAVVRFDENFPDLDGDSKKEGVVKEVLGWGVELAKRDIHLAIQLALKELEVQ